MTESSGEDTIAKLWLLLSEEQLRILKKPKEFVILAAELRMVWFSNIERTAFNCEMKSSLEVGFYCRNRRRIRNLHLLLAAHRTTRARSLFLSLSYTHCLDFVLAVSG